MSLTIQTSVSVKDSSKTNYSIDGDLDGEVSLKEYLEFVKRSLIAISLDALREEQGKGFDKKPIVVVDNRQSKDILSVSPLGKIEFVSSTTSGVDVVLDIYKQLLFRSKVVTGTYISGNFVFYNGNFIAGSWTSLKRWAKTAELKKGDTIRFVNVIPYARKLERYGVTAQKSRTRTVKSRDKQKRSGETILGANGTYYLTYRAALREFKNNLFVNFGFILGSTLGVAGIPAVTKDGKTLRRTYSPTKRKPKNSGPYLYPYIKLTVGERGII